MASHYWYWESALRAYEQTPWWRFRQRRSLRIEVRYWAVVLEHERAAGVTTR